jgi:hypothetical protein
MTDRPTNTEPGDDAPVDDLDEGIEEETEAASDLDEISLDAAAAEAEIDRGTGAGLPVGVPAAGAAAGRAGPRPTGTARTIALDPSLRIRDRASAVFVVLAVVVFLAIFANAMLFGVGGAVTTTAPPSPSSIASGSATPSGSPGPSSTTAPSQTAGPSAS